MSNVPGGIGTSSSSFPVLPVVIVRGDACFFFLLVVLFEMTGTCRSFGCMCVVSVFSVGRIFVFVGGLAVGGVTVVILPCFCCFFLSCFSITSTRAKRRSQTNRATFGDISSFNIPRTNSLVSLSQGFFNNIPEMYSAVSSSVSFAMVEHVCVIISASIFSGLLVFDGVLIVDRMGVLMTLFVSVVSVVIVGDSILLLKIVVVPVLYLVSIIAFSQSLVVVIHIVISDAVSIVVHVE
mmetsp:Transcript_7992/g.8571  ORF Transcript_7992/g.8571 Transcript_7992/m.8571 type:complete len:237 (-) Transcript_7992:81-791(-)